MNVVLVDPIAATANLTPRSIVRPQVPSMGRDPRSIRETKLVELATELALRGHRATVVLGDVFLDGQAWAFPGGVEVVPIHTVLRFPFHPGLIPATPSLLSLRALRGADVIQVGEFHQPATFLACLATRGTSVPVVIWQETFRRMRFPGFLYQRAYESTVGHVVRAHGSRFIPRTTKARIYLRDLQVQEESIGPWIPTGVDTNAFVPRRGHLSAEDFGWPDGARILLLVGRLHPTKGIDLSLRMLKWLLRRHPDVRLVIRGAGPARAELLRLAKSLGVDEAVRIIDRRSREEMVDLYNLAEVVLNTSRVDLLPFSLMEGSACGRPCVATDVGAIRDIVVDGKTGLVVRERDVAEMGGAVCALLRDDELRLALGREGRRRAERHFALSTVANMLLEVYRDVASKAAS